MEICRKSVSTYSCRSKCNKKSPERKHVLSREANVISMSPHMPISKTDYELWKTLFQAVGYAVTWCIIIFGWRVNEAQNRQRDQRKDLREQIDLITGFVRNVESDVVSCMLMHSDRARASYWTVYFEVQRIYSDVCRIGVMKKKPVIDALIAYRAAVTEKALPGPDSARQSEVADALLKEVSRKGNELIRAMEDRYAELYP